MAVAALAKGEKQPGEVVPVTFEYSGVLDEDESIVQILSGYPKVLSSIVGDSSPLAFVTSPETSSGGTTPAPAISGKTVVAWVKDGTNRKDYLISCAIRTNAGRTSQADGVVQVRTRCNG